MRNIYLFTLLFLAEPHFGATWPFMVDKKNNYIKKENSLTLIYFPILICVFCLAGFFLFSSLFFLIFYLANFFHVTRQSAGISNIWKIKDNQAYSVDDFDDVDGNMVWLKYSEQVDDDSDNDSGDEETYAADDSPEDEEVDDSDDDSSDSDESVD